MARPRFAHSYLWGITRGGRGEDHCRVVGAATKVAEVYKVASGDQQTPVIQPSRGVLRSSRWQFYAGTETLTVGIKDGACGLRTRAIVVVAAGHQDRAIEQHTCRVRLCLGRHVPRRAEGLRCGVIKLRGLRRKETKAVYANHTASNKHAAVPEKRSRMTGSPLCHVPCAREAARSRIVNFGGAIVPGAIPTASDQHGSVIQQSGGVASSRNGHRAGVRK